MLWGRVVKSGKKMPLDVEPDPERGNVLIDEDDGLHVMGLATAAALRGAGQDLYLMHRANPDCPGPDGP